MCARVVQFWEHLQNISNRINGVKIRENKVVRARCIVDVVLAQPLSAVRVQDELNILWSLFWAQRSVMLVVGLKSKIYL